MTLSEPIYAEATAPIHIGSATVAGHIAVARVFADAFQDDPIFAWAIPDAERRHAIARSCCTPEAAHLQAGNRPPMPRGGSAGSAATSARR